MRLQCFKYGPYVFMQMHQDEEGFCRTTVFSLSKYYYI